MTFYREFVIGGNFDMFIRPFITILPIVVKLPDVEWLSLPGYLDVVWWENRNLSCLQVSWRVLPLPRGRSRLPRQCAGVQWGETRGFTLSPPSNFSNWELKDAARRSQKPKVCKENDTRETAGQQEQLKEPEEEARRSSIYLYQSVDEDHPDLQSIQNIVANMNFSAD